MTVQSRAVYHPSPLFVTELPRSYTCCFVCFCFYFTLVSLEHSFSQHSAVLCGSRVGVRLGGSFGALKGSLGTGPQQRVLWEPLCVLWPGDLLGGADDILQEGPGDGWMKRQMRRSSGQVDRGWESPEAGWMCGCPGDRWTGGREARENSC